MSSKYNVMKNLRIRSVKIAAILAMSLLFFSNTKGTHLVGGTVCYEYIGFDTSANKHLYLVTSRLVRDPIGQPLPSTIGFGVYNNNVPSYTLYANINIAKIGIDTIYPAPYVCIYDTTLLNSMYYQVGIYQDTIALPASAVGYHMLYSSCCRSGAIINVYAGSMTFYAYIPPTSYNNSSPCFTGPVAPFICNNNTVQFSNMVSEPDGDSLIYSLVAPIESVSLPNINHCNYQGGFSDSMPLGIGSIATIDSFTGVATIMSPIVGNFCLGVEVKEYRNNVLMSITTKEIMLLSYNCNVVYSGCVWPGDANSDNIVNNIDLLNIGVGYGSTGPERVNASLMWFAQNASDWVDTFATGENYKHADCNGDSTINSSDTVAILQNYNKVHSKNSGQGSGSSNGGLFLTFESDTAESGDSLSVTVHLGDSLNPVNDIYGLAFTITYDPTLIDSGTINIDFIDSWLGSAANTLHLAKDFADVGKTDVAISRIDQTNVSGYGPICIASIVIEDNLDGIQQLPLVLTMDIANTVFIDKDENLLALNSSPDSIVIWEPTGMEAITKLLEKVHIYPNPADGILTISTGTLAIDEIVITDMVGQIVYANKPKEGDLLLDISNLYSGLYLVVINSGSKRVVKKLSIIN